MIINKYTGLATVGILCLSIVSFVLNHEIDEEADLSTIAEEGEKIAFSYGKSKEKIDSSSFGKDATSSLIILSDAEIFIQDVLQAIGEFKSIEAKRDKSAQDQLKLHVLLNKCSRGITSEELFKIDPSHQLYEYYSTVQKGCEPFLKLLDQSHDQVKSRAEAWLEAAAENGNPAAKLLSLVNYPAPTFEQFNNVVFQALTETSRDPTLKGDIYKSVLSFLTNNSDGLNSAFNYDIAQDYSLSSDIDAWGYLWCSNSFECKIEQDYTDKTYFQHELDAIRLRAKELEASIKEESWEDLRLVPKRS